jgi:hypothetical protein
MKWLFRVFATFAFFSVPVIAAAQQTSISPQAQQRVGEIMQQLKAMPPGTPARIMGTVPTGGAPMKRVPHQAIVAGWNYFAPSYCEVQVGSGIDAYFVITTDDHFFGTTVPDDFPGFAAFCPSGRQIAFNILNPNDLNSWDAFLMTTNLP